MGRVPLSKLQPLVPWLQQHLPFTGSWGKRKRHQVLRQPWHGCGVAERLGYGKENSRLRFLPGISLQDPVRCLTLRPDKPRDPTVEILSRGQMHLSYDPNISHVILYMCRWGTAPRASRFTRGRSWTLCSLHCSGPAGEHPRVSIVMIIPGRAEDSVGWGVESGFILDSKWIDRDLSQ